MGLPVIDWSISVGNLLQMLIIVAGGVSVFFALKADVRIIRHDMNNLKERQSALNDAFKQLGDILTKVAVQEQRFVQQDQRFIHQDQRMDAIERDVDELRRGRGFINPMSS